MADLVDGGRIQSRAGPRCQSAQELVDRRVFGLPCLSYSLTVLEVVAAILATVAVVATAAAMRSSGRVRALTALAGLSATGAVVIALAELGEPQLVVSLGLACLMVGILLGAAREQRDATADLELQRHLARCRRRGEAASALVVALPDGAPMRKDVTEALRITDSAAVRRFGNRWELNAILDAEDLPRHIVEARLTETLTTSKPGFGWATFPADGLTLDALFELARARIGNTAPAPPAEPADAPSRAPDDPAPAT